MRRGSKEISVKRDGTNNKCSIGAVYEEEEQYRLKKTEEKPPHFDFTHMMNRVNKNKMANSDLI